ncbi:MAG: hypothetical protein AB7G25_04125 [Sphingomonadaceae bacterium]
MECFRIDESGYTGFASQDEESDWGPKPIFGKVDLAMAVERHLQSTSIHARD